MNIRKQVIIALLIGLVLVLGLGVGIFLAQILPLRGTESPVSKQPNSPGATTGLSSVARQAPAATLEQSLEPGTTQVPLPTPFPAVEWSAVPPCENQPASPETLVQSLAAPGAAPGAQALDYRRAALLSPKLAALDSAQINSLLADPNAELSSFSKKTFVGLAINLATGRLNRASEVSFQNLPDVKTVGDLFTHMENSLGDQAISPDLVQAAQQVQLGQGITRPVCARLLITQSSNQAADLLWASSGVQATKVSLDASAQPRFVVDAATTAPDGRHAILTSVGYDSGGPVYVMDLANNQASNLIDKMNAAQVGGEQPLPPDTGWDVIGWLPDSQHVLIGSLDTAAVYRVDINSGKFERFGLKNAINSSSQMAGLSPDGSQVVYVADSPEGDGQQLILLNPADGKSSTILKLPYSEGAFYYPRFSPDGQSLSYMIQKGQPDTGQTQAIYLYALKKRTTTQLVEGSLGLSLPTWSPDGRYLAFSRKDPGELPHFDPARPLDQARQNLWVVETATGKFQQLTNLNGQALRPRWAPDARTLSFVTHDGQVGMVSVDQPGFIWRAAATSAQQPEFTSTFFIP